MQIIIPTDKEIFKPITYPGVKKSLYLISNYGSVYSTISNRLLTPYTDTKGYLRVQLMCDNSATGSNFKVHRLVAWEFCPGYNTDTGMIYPNHRDSNRQNNYYTNLEWSTAKENVIHSFEDGFRISKRGSNHYANKYSEDLIVHIKSMILNGYTNKQIMKYFGYEYGKDNIKLRNLITDIKRGKVWRHVEGSTTIEKYCIYIDTDIE